MTDSPIVVYGALRSGTTWLRLMLDAHPALHHPGEADFLFDHMRPAPSLAAGWRYDRTALAADRMFRAQNIDLPRGLDGPALFDALLAALAAKGEGQLCLTLHRGLPAMLAQRPGTRVVHLLRDPRDVARSTIAMGWRGTLYHAVGQWMDTERDWDRACASLDPARWHEVHYERLAARPEATLAALCTALGLAPETRRMLSYPHHSTYAPPTLASCGRWRRDGRAAELEALESRAAGLMTARGYPTETAAQPPGPRTRAAFWLRDKVNVWRHGVRTHGAVVFVGERLARRLRLTPVQRALQRRIDDRVNRLLK